MEKGLGDLIGDDQAKTYNISKNVLGGAVSMRCDTSKKTLREKKGGATVKREVVLKIKRRGNRLKIYVALITRYAVTGTSITKGGDYHNEGLHVF